jgi:hypothetical protein
LVGRFHQSELTQPDFAARHGIGVSTLGKRLHRGGQVILTPVKSQEATLPTPGKNVDEREIPTFFYFTVDPAWYCSSLTFSIQSTSLPSSAS